MQRCILESDILSYLQAREGRVPRSIIHTRGLSFIDGCIPAAREM